MDFGEKGFTKLTICGHCPIDQNTIHIRFHGDSGDYNELAEFSHTSDFEEQTFDLQSETGMQTVTFIFLPGSNFDFKWFHFE
jgi:beta-galactosidase